MTVLEVIQKSADFLSKKDVDSPRLQAELLLAHVLKLPRMKLYLNFERVLTPAETDSMRELVKRRGQREPLQHITGSTSFCGLEIAVNRHVLVPRPETELLAEMGWEFLGEHSTFNSDKSRAGIQHSTSNARSGDAGSRSSRREEAQIENPGIEKSLLTSAATTLDFGTGSGCVAIALAVKCPAACVVAVDVSPDALVVAKDNAARNGVAERIEFLCGDGLAALVTDGSRGRSPHQFDLIVSNPPYIASAEIGTLQPEVRDFDPRGALDGGADGLDFYRMFAEKASVFLKPGGKIMLEFGDGQADAIKKLFEVQMWVVESVRDDYSGRARILVARR